MTAAEIAQVSASPLFAGAGETCLESILAGEIVDLPVGTIIANEGEKTGFFYVVLDGELRITRTYDRQTILMAVTKTGGYTGETIMLLDIPWLACVRVSKPARIFRLDEDNFWRMLGACPAVARELFRAAANRMKNMEGYTQQREKLASLGTMAAGLAHEMNNPAAAARRAAAHLQPVADRLQSLMCEMSRTLNHDHWEYLLQSAQRASELQASTPPLNSLERSDRAEAIASWLDSKGVTSAWDVAPTFVTAGLDAPWLTDFIAKLPEAAHAVALGWLEVRLNLKAIVSQVEQSTSRIAELVKAVKSYSYMDQSPMQEVDVHEGIESTLTMLGYKLRGMTVERAYDRSLPKIMAYGSELNQVWTNLIDNAADAGKGAGKICVGTYREDDQIVVEIVDFGPGIPMEVQTRMFEPFFTTKSVGTGTGLGLVISNRIVGDRHGGEIEFESRPGETRFRVRLPLHHPKLIEPAATTLDSAAK